MTLAEQRPASLFLVDDDDIALSSLRALFSLETDYAVTCFSDPLHAVQELERSPVDVVISDYLMPRMNGIELLREVRRLQPETPRILLTGFADKENAIRAINEVGLYQYLEKPWDNQALLIVVRNAVFEKNLRQQLGQKISELDKLLWEHKQLAERHGYLEREMEMAGRVQKSLLPVAAPQLPGFRLDSLYRPCRHLGGDYYDYAVRDRQAAILVSDVSGHGAQAALISMLLKASFQDAAARSLDPSQLLAEMNAVLHRFLPAGMFVAACVLTLDTRQPVVLLASAGLPHPFVLRRGLARLDELPLEGFPLGLFAGGGLGRYELREVSLSAGDTLLIATDGLGEIQGSGGELFQDREFRRALSDLGGRTADNFLEELLNRATRFSASSSLADDVTLLAVTRC